MIKISFGIFKNFSLNMQSKILGRSTKPVTSSKSLLLDSIMIFFLLEIF